MKKTLLVLFAIASTLIAKADEGMWTLYNLPQAVYQQMKGQGFELPYNSIYKGKDAIMKGVVNFSGYCSGVVVSPDGLVFTNHHCGFEAIRSHSTVEHDYMKDGFYAKSYAEELPNKDTFVSFMIEQKDITSELEALGIDKKTTIQKELLIDSLENVLTRRAKAIDSTYHVNIDPFYEGNKYYATTYQDFTDVRLVFTVPKSMGKFGGETDNWMWPRQTCDFSVFRIYADPKTNKPAAYSKDNVPYKPAHWAPVSLKGYAEDSFAMTMGYPGSTNRYLSSYGIKERRDAINEPTAQVRGVKQEVMTRHMRASEAVRIKYDSKFARSANYWKNSIGMNKCIDSIGIINQKKDYENRLRRWQDSTGYLKGKLNFNRMGALYAQRFDLMRTMRYFRETFHGTGEFVDRANRLNRMEIKGSKNNKKAQFIEFENNEDAWDEALDKEVLGVLLKNYREHVDKQYLPKFYTEIDQKFGGNYVKYVDYLYKNSLLMKKNTKIYVYKKKALTDPGVLFGLDLLDIRGALSHQLNAIKDSIDLQEKYLCAAKLRMEEDMPHYSDANFTMRLSYGQVKSYDLGGNNSGYFTTAPTIVKKMNRGQEVYDYRAEPILKELLSAKDFGQYTDKASKDLQLCFLTTNDITGGNSGSPIFNGKGELIGLAFDGNWDSLSSDINFDARLARCIGVDVRYMLYLMDKWGHADRLLKEINAK